MIQPDTMISTLYPAQKWEVCRYFCCDNIVYLYFISIKKKNVNCESTKLYYYIIGLAKDGVEPPAGFMAPSAWEILANYYKSLNKL